MLNTLVQDLTDPGNPPLMMTHDLQDNLLAACNDLNRLQILLADACAALMRGFCGATQQIRMFSQRSGTATNSGLPEGFDAALQHLASAITALQFQDMASQLIEHTRQRLCHCADRIACKAVGDEGDNSGPIPVTAAALRPNPVTQDEMAAGAVELF